MVCKPETEWFVPLVVYQLTAERERESHAPPPPPAAFPASNTAQCVFSMNTTVTISKINENIKKTAVLNFANLLTTIGPTTSAVPDSLTI